MRWSGLIRKLSVVVDLSSGPPKLSAKWRTPPLIGLTMSYYRILSIRVVMAIIVR